MARVSQDAIETFMTITGASEVVAIQKLEEHRGDLNEAVNSYFSEGDRTNVRSSLASFHHDSVSTDEIIDVDFPRLRNRQLDAQSFNPFSHCQPMFGSATAASIFTRQPHISHPREVKDIPIEFKDGNPASGFNGQRPLIEDVTGLTTGHEPEVHGTVTIDDDEDDLSTAPPGYFSVQSVAREDSSEVPFARHRGPSIIPLVDEAGYQNDIEEEMVQAAIEASRREAEEHMSKQASSSLQIDKKSPDLNDVVMARAVSLSLKVTKQEKALRDKGTMTFEKGSPNYHDMDVDEVERPGMPNGRKEYSKEALGGQNELISEDRISEKEDSEDIEVQPLVRRRSRRLRNAESTEDEPLDVNRSSSSRQHVASNQPQQNGYAFQSDEWGGISSEEHDEAVMLEAAMFGGIPGRTAYHFGFPNGSVGNQTVYPRVPRPLSPTLTEQRLLREQQDGEYRASLQADREKELKAIQDAEIQRMKEAAALEAALENERHQEEENHKKFLENEDFERKIAGKQVSLPEEPSAEDENVVTFLFRMPDGSRTGRRFLKSDKMQSLLDFIDIARTVKPGGYRLVRAYPRRAFTDEESELTLSELGLTGKQEALYIELI